ASASDVLWWRDYRCSARQGRVRQDPPRRPPSRLGSGLHRGLATSFPRHRRGAVPPAGGARPQPAGGPPGRAGRHPSWHCPRVSAVSIAVVPELSVTSAPLAGNSTCELVGTVRLENGGAGDTMTPLSSRAVVSFSDCKLGDAVAPLPPKRKAPSG